jgi:restriction endonuclease S subunit
MPDPVARAGWTRVAFGDVVRQVRDTVDPIESGLEIFVAGEHMATDDLRIRRWGSVGDGYLGPAFHMRFKPGQVLYGSRRTYLRKIALAEFEGVTANTTFVLESKNPKVLLPELLPFIMQKEGFHEHSIKQSKGSVNPYINFTDLIWYEFDLPPLDEQLRIVKVLRAALAQQDALYDVLEQARRTLAAELVVRLDHGPEPLKVAPQLPHGWLYVPLGELISIRHGYAFDGECFTDEQTSDPILLTPGNFSLRGELTFPSHKTKRFQGNPPEDYWLNPGDIVVLMTDLTPAATLLGAPGIVEDSAGRVLQNQRVGLVRNLAPSRVSDSFLFYSFLGGQLRRLIRALSAGSTVSHTSPTQICALRIPLPTIEGQAELTGRWMAMSDASKRIESRLDDARSLTARLRDRALRDD